jgi:hypothetical protein
MASLFGRIGEFLTGKSDKFRSTLTGGQQNFQNQLLQQLQGMGGQGGGYGMAQDYYKDILSGNPDAYNQFASPYLQNFEQQIIPRLSERFAGLGGGLGGGVGSSSGFGQAIGGAGAQLQAQLAQLYAGLRQNAAQQQTGQYNQLAAYGLNPTQAYQPGTLGFLGSALPGAMQGFGQGFGQQAGFNMMKGWGQQQPNQGIYDTFGPNAGNGTYNPYTGYQG